MYRFGCVVFAFVVGAFVFAAGARGDDVWRMAGTFNNWNASDDAWAMERHPDRSWVYRLEKLLEPGRYEFKFVKNGNWGEGHFGASGEGRGLEQPGEDIELVVDGLAYYRIVLNTQDRVWRQEIARVEEPIVSAWLYGEARVAGPMVLDLRDTIAASPLHEVELRFEYDASRVKVSRQPGGAFMAAVVPLKPGKTEIGVEVVDGDRVGRSRVSFDAAHPMHVEVELTPTNGARVVETVRVPMRPLEGRVQEGVVDLDGAFEGLGDVGMRVLTVSLHYLGREVESVEVGEVVDGGVWRVRGTADGFVRMSGEGESAGPLVAAPNTVRFSLEGRDDDGTWRRSVHVVGDFNNWAEPRSRGALELDRVLIDGMPAFEGWVELPDGVHEYAFAVDRVNRVADPSRDRVDARTSRVFVGDRPSDFDRPRRDGVVAEAVKHDPRFGTYFRALSDGMGLVDVSVRALRGDVDEAFVVIEGEGVERRELPLERRRDASGFDFWEGRVMVGRSAFDYSFSLRSGSARMHTRGFEAELGSSLDVDLPDWAKGAVYYQIFAERFRNGNALNDPHGDDVFMMPWGSDWYAVSSAEEARWREAYGVPAEEGWPERQGGKLFHTVWDRRYGGDLQGVVEKLDYLRDLGVTAIYFNPVFEGESMHKYDATDFRHIEDNFGHPVEAGRVPEDFVHRGTEKADPAGWGWTEADRYFLDVVLPEAKARGIRIVIDGVWNHTGRDFWAFEDVMEKGAASEYADWFYCTFDEDGNLVGWVTWDNPDPLGQGWLPKFRQKADGDLIEPVKEHLFHVTTRWMDPDGDGDPSDGIDGWRLDVPLDVGAPFWVDWREHVKSINPEAVIIAEIWGDEEANPWLTGDHFDTQMHYPFGSAVVDWLAVRPGMTSGELAAALDDAFDNLPQTHLIHMNLFGSHDTDRYISMLINPGRGWDQGNRPQDNGPNYVDVRPSDEVYELAMLGVAMQAGYMGAPCVYYGDEVGMWGADDPTNRKPFPWDDEGPYERDDTFADWERAALYGEWFGLRGDAEMGPVLKYGSVRHVETGDDDVFAFVRSLNGDRVLVVLNRGEGAYNAGRLLRPLVGTAPVSWEGVGSVGWRVDGDGERLGLSRVGRMEGVSARVWFVPGG